MAGRFPVIRDIIERAWNTAWQTVAAALVADGVSLIDLRNLSFWQGVGLAGLGAAGALIKAALAQMIGRKGASLDPQVGLAPTETAEPVR